MTETEILGLRKPAGSDYFSVEDFNHNVDVLETSAQSKVTTLRVCGDLNSAALVIHSSGSYAGNSVEHDDGGTYAEFILPCGGHVDITHIVNGIKHSRELVLVEGSTEWVVTHQMTVYDSPLARAPDDYFSTSKNFSYVGRNRVLYCISKQTLEELQAIETDFTYAEDYKNHLWHATRTGMITAEEYATATGEEYTNVPPHRITQY